MSSANLENMIRDLKDELKKRDEQHSQQLKALEAKICQANSRTSGGRRRKIQVPSLCRYDFRKWYKILKKGRDFAGFNCNESIDSTSNKNIILKVMEAVEDEHKTADQNCPWSHAQLRGAAATYYKTRCDAAKRREKGSTAEHNQMCRRQGRMRDKLQRRIKGLQLQSTWSSKKKEAVEAVLNLDYMSSDESDLSDDENGPILRGYLTNRLIWERSSLTKVKSELDKSYYGSLPRRTRSAILKRSPNDGFSGLSCLGSKTPK